MPNSDPNVRSPAIDHIISNSRRLSKPVLEIGVGSGFYGRTLKGVFPGIEIFGIEVWPPYITPDHLNWYKSIFLANALNFDYSLLINRVSLIIAADVVEHFEKPDALHLMSIWKKLSPWILITLPIVVFEQGAYQGNIHETHLHHWTIEEVERDLGMTLIKDCGVCGLFQYKER